MLRWLHISDLHFNNDDMSTISLREELPQFLKSNNLLCDYVFCTGDIRTANANPNTFTDEAAKYLIDLCAAVGLTTDRLFIVPGNHDVDRNSDGRDGAIKRISFQREGYYDPPYGTIKDEDLRIIYSGQNDFRNFLSKLYSASRMEKYSNPLQPHFNIETPDLNVLHIDSTLTYTQKQESTDLVIGTKLLQNALKEVNPNKPTILLSHYPFTALLQEEKKYVRELLWKKGVRLWLGGHEHDHMVHPIDYLDSLQAGELRMEERSRATVLIGEVDENTHTGYVTAYTWFAEGWAKYPILWHDGRKEDQYPFQLRLPGDNGQSREAVKANRANTEFVGRTNVIESILPRIEGVEEDSLKEVLSHAWITEKPHLILLANGGMGKTTMLLNMCENSENVNLYIPAERLVAMRMGIKSYCVRSLFDGDEARFEEFCGVKYSQPSLVLLVDGLNEIDAKTERDFINEIKALNLLKGIQFVVSSRTNFTARYSMTGYSVRQLIPLSDEQIETVFSAEEWSGIKDTFTLHKLLSNPMMVTMYKEICPIIKQYEKEECLDWIIPIKNSSDLLHNYYVAQIAVLLQRSGVDGEKIQIAYQAVFEILPALAYEFDISYCLNKSNVECRELLQRILKEHHVNEEKILPLQERFRDYDLPALKFGTVFDFLTCQTNLLYKNDTVTAFPHQIYRDYLSATWILQQTELEKYWNGRAIPFPVMEHIRNLSGKYWDGLAERIHAIGENRDDAFQLVRNLLDCFPSSETGGCANYSNLDLRGLQIPNAVTMTDDRISLRGAKIDCVSVGKSSEDVTLYTHLRFSPQNEFLAASSNGKVFVFSLQTEEPTFIYSISSSIARIEFIGGYLFVVTGGSNTGIHVFQKKDEWVYCGKILNPAEMHCDLFNSRFRFAILKDDVLYFYYNNREVRFSLTECKRIYNKQKQNAWKNPVNGIDASFLKAKDNAQKNRKAGVNCQTESQGLRATATVEGDLTITSGNEVQAILARGVTCLKDGAISGNGKSAATLSYELSNGKRKIQLWDLDKKIRVGDVLAPSAVEQVHLSENGAFILGETDTKTWVYNVEKRTSRLFNEHFVSDQHGKVSTYGTKVLRKETDLNLCLYDLKTDEVLNVENPCKNVKLACFMPDGSIAAVGNNIRKVKFKNIRTGNYSEVNSQSAPVIGISSFKNEPFIAVATQDNVISIYHIGDCMRKRILGKTVGNYMMVVSPESTVIACSNGHKALQTFNYYEKTVDGQKRGWWYSNPYSSEDPTINGDVLDIAFNTENHELVAILSNGQIMFCHERYCRFHSATDIITNFNVDAYDFRGCICDEEIKKQIRQNGGIIDV